MLKGKDLALYVAFDDTTAELLALSKSCTLDLSVDMIEVASIAVGKCRKVIPGKYSWQVTSDSLVAVQDAQLQKLMKAATTRQQLMVFFEGSPSDSGALFHRWYGNCYIQSINVSGSLGSMATHKVTLVGNGPLSGV